MARKRVADEPVAGPHAMAWASTVTALYAAERIDVTHESAVTQGAILASMLDSKPFDDQAPKWHSELRQVRRELMGDDEDDGDVDVPGAELVRQLGALGFGRPGRA